MSPLYLYNGKLLVSNNKLASSINCCCNICGRCYVNGVVDPYYLTQEECEKCRSCYELVLPECDGDCPAGYIPANSLISLEFSSSACGLGGSGTAIAGCGAILYATVTDGGSGYATVEYSEPTLTLSVPGGFGGVLSIDNYNIYAPGSLHEGWYGIGNITVTNGGSGYTDNASVTITLGTNDKQKPGYLAPNINIRTQINPPADTWTVTPFDPPIAGTGLVVSLTLAAVGTSYPLDTQWKATAASVVNGGTNYVVDDILRVEGSTTIYETLVRVTSIGPNGSVTGLAVYPDFGEGLHNGIDTGIIIGVNFNPVFRRGIYRKQTVSVCAVDVAISQTAPSNGNDAIIAATVENDPDNPNFGKVISLAITEGGSGYVSLCERTTTVASCNDCPSRESPESSICSETGGCPCGTWVADTNQADCACCKWFTTYGMWIFFDEWFKEQYPELVESQCNALITRMQALEAGFASAGWTTTELEPPTTPEGLEPDCGYGFKAECPECYRAFPKSFTYILFQLDNVTVPCDKSQWVALPGDLGNWEPPSPAMGCNSTSYPIFTFIGADGMFYIPKCGPRITECTCCLKLSEPNIYNQRTILDQVQVSCCAECPDGYECAPGACNPLP